MTIRLIRNPVPALTAMFERPLPLHLRTTAEVTFEQARMGMDAARDEALEIILQMLCICIGTMVLGLPVRLAWCGLVRELTIGMF